MSSAKNQSQEKASRSIGLRVANLLHSGRSTRDVAIVEGVVRTASRPVDKMLDIGCSDGRIASQIAVALGADAVGVDVEIQKSVAITARQYDGRQLPFDDSVFDLVTIVDVLHHAEDPQAVLNEAVRVLRPSGRVVIKDHVRWGRWSNWILGRMDNLSNYGVHEITAGRYLSESEWRTLYSTASAEVEVVEAPFRVHGLPWRLVARDRYHHLVALRKLA